MSTDVIHATQLELIPSEQLSDDYFFDAESGRNPEFTARRFFARYPDKFSAVIQLTAEGLGAILIGKILHISANTVLACRREYPELVDIARQRLAELSRSAAQMCVEAIIDLLSDDLARSKLSVRDLAIAHGVLVDKSELLSGGVTARVEHISGSPDHDSYIDYIRSLRSADAIVSPPTTGLEAGKDGQIGGQVVGSEAGDIGVGAEVRVDDKQDKDEGGALRNYVK